MEMLRPRGWSLAALATVVALMVGAFLASDYVSGLLTAQAQMRSRISALENRVPESVTVSPSPSPTEPADSEPAPPESGDASDPGADPPVAAASGAREPVSRSPQDPGAGGSPSRPGPERPPAAAPPSAEEPDDCSGGTLINLCLDLGLLSAEEP